MAAPTEQRIAVPIDDPNADTEWFVTPLKSRDSFILTPPKERHSEKTWRNPRKASQSDSYDRRGHS